MSEKPYWVINPTLMAIQHARPGQPGFESEIEATYALMDRLRQRITADVEKHRKLSERAALLVEEEATND